MTDYNSLVQEDADEAIALLDELFQKAANGDASNLREWVRLLQALYEAEEFDLFTEALEELPEDCPPGLISILLSLNVSQPAFVGEAVAVLGGHPSLANEELLQLILMREEPYEADDDQYNASKSGRASVAECPNASETMLLELAADTRWEIRYRVAMNPALTQTIQDMLLRTESSADESQMGKYILAALAVNRNASQSTLEKLAVDGSPFVRESVALRAGLSEEVKNALLRSGTTEGTRSYGGLIWWDTRGVHWMADLTP